jgi:hypothetical protein
MITRLEHEEIIGAGTTPSPSLFFYHIWFPWIFLVLCSTRQLSCDIDGSFLLSTERTSPPRSMRVPEMKSISTGKLTWCQAMVPTLPVFAQSTSTGYPHEK